MRRTCKKVPNTGAIPDGYFGNHVYDRYRTDTSVTIIMQAANGMSFGDNHVALATLIAPPKIICPF